MKALVHWFHRDLRLTDNTALLAAARRGQPIVPVFILDDANQGQLRDNPAQAGFLLHSLQALSRDLKRLGYSLLLRRGAPEVELLQVCREAKAEAVFFNEIYEPEAVQCHARCFNALNTAGIGLEGFKDAVVWKEREILTQAGNPYTVFTPYARAWKNRPIPLPDSCLAPAAHKPVRAGSLPLPHDTEAWGISDRPPLWAAGELAALDALRLFLDRSLFHYAHDRDYPALDATSHLSSQLHFGTISIRQILAAVKQAGAKAGVESSHQVSVFVTELIWREFYQQILANFPQVATGNFRHEYDTLPWSENGGHFQAWRAGQTGYPIVDAAMRCLKTTGWMHNRLRMIAAMFLTKDLFLPWQWGEKHFRQTLVDGDLAANNGGWQWSAGTGTDAAPYFRIFNPASQGEKFDPRGDFVRRWVPELAALPAAQIHRPWDGASAVRDFRGYPEPIVRHEEQRRRCLAAFQAVKRRRVKTRDDAEFG